MIDDYIAAEKIQNQNWQYFIECVNTVENGTIVKKYYETFYNVVERNFYPTINKLSIDERDKIKDDFLRENFWAENVVTQLDCWVSFYFQHERFPGL